MKPYSLTRLLCIPAAVLLIAGCGGNKAGGTQDDAGPDGGMEADGGEDGGGTGRLRSTPDRTMDGEHGLAGFGVSIAPAGDVNNDGYPDIVVGSNLYSNPEICEGKAYVFYGGPDGLSMTPGWTAESDTVDAFFGGKVASAGDVNGDGFDDIIVGAPQIAMMPRNIEGPGWAAVYLGSDNGPSAQPDWIVQGEHLNALFGCSVASAGDVNGDGFDDVIVGSFSYRSGGGFVIGRAYVFMGSENGLDATPEWTGDGSGMGTSFGAHVASAGDVNGDGFDDVMISAVNWYTGGVYGIGKIYLYLGSSDGVDASPHWTAEGTGRQEQFGQSIARA